VASDLPIACSLGPTELAGRLAELRALGRGALVASRAGPTHARLRFAGGDEVHARLAAVVAAESRCCAFLTLRLTRDGGTLLLDLEAPEGAEPVLAELVGGFRAG
jgi:hypothetical protein